MRCFVLALFGTVVSIAGCGEEAFRPPPKAGDNSHTNTAGNSRGTPAASDTQGQTLGAEVSAGRIRLKAPSGWQRRQPRSQFTLAEFALPKAEADEQDGRLTVSVAGGSVEANLQRWRDQFSGEQKSDAVKQIDAAGLSVSVIDLSGTFNDQAGPFAPAVERQGYRMLGAIVPVDDQLHFVKAYGQAKTMAKHEAAFYVFLKTLTRE